MVFKELEIPGAFYIEAEPKRDERGGFGRTFCVDEFKNAGLNFEHVQCNISENFKAGTLRGMHFQHPPFEEPKLVSCTQGKIFDVVLDLRKDSPAYCQWWGKTLSPKSLNLLFIPRGCAHGFLTLEENSTVFYQMGSLYKAEAASGVRFDDPIFDIEWPRKIEMISERDRTFPDFKK